MSEEVSLTEQEIQGWSNALNEMEWWVQRCVKANKFPVEFTALTIRHLVADLRRVGPAVLRGDQPT